MNDIVVIDSISQVHRLTDSIKPSHPQVTIFRHCHIDPDLLTRRFRNELYIISLKEGVTGTIGYGRSHYDFSDGTMTFFAPGQVVIPSEFESLEDSSGWSVIFHPDLIRRHSLGKHIDSYSFFGYEANEALHLSEAEKQSLKELVDKIERELSQPIDRHTLRLICSNIELMLDYCSRYYDRQFYTRSNQSHEVAERFEALLRSYFEKPETLLEKGLPTVSYCAAELGISANYLSDLLKKETGRNARDHIHGHVIERAKTALLASGDAVSQIAYSLGFEYPAHFTKLFKNHTGESPSQFRKHH